MKILIDEFPLEITHVEADEWQVELISSGVWMGPVTPETEAARIQGLKDAWVGQDERKQEHAERLKANRYTGPTHQHGMSKTHRENLSKAGMGNQNARKKPK